MAKQRTAREVLEDIAAFPIHKEFEYDEHGKIKNGSRAYSAGFAAWRNQQLAIEWLKNNV